MNRYAPMMAGVAEAPFNGEDWIFEIKWDGVRAIAYIGETLSIRSRNDREMLGNFPELRGLSILISDAVIDGEIIVMRGGRPDFQLVAERVQASKPGDIEELSSATPATYVVFDILEKDGKPLTGLPLSVRKTMLKYALRESDHIVISSYVEAQGDAYYSAAIAKGLEGIIAKKKSSLYQPGKRSKDWLKIKRVRTGDFVILGYTKGEGSRSSTFGALLLGLYDGDSMVYLGRVGTGFTDRALSELFSALNELRTDIVQVIAADIPENVTWVEPKLVAEVGYQSITTDNRVRAPRFIRLRRDKAAVDCVLAQVRDVALMSYVSRRDFTKSPEPMGVDASRNGDGYVVQEHHARRLHWDLRLEKDGVLKSWAVPKQPPERAGERRLAVMVEDHPLEYATFEGTIPEGEYGAGTVKLWDRGTYDVLKWTDEKVEFVLHGERLNGQYELIRFKKAGQNQWLVFKKKEG